jgi:hypothetical protein
VPVSIGSFGSGVSIELFQVKYVNITTTTDYLGRSGDNPDPLWPIANADNISLVANENTSIWFSVFVDINTIAGDYCTNISVDGINIPVCLHVFDFRISDTLHVKSQMNFSHNTILTKYSVPGYTDEYWFYVNKMKQFIKDHRLTPKSVTWPGGVTSASSSNGTAYPFIDYDCNGGLTDNDGIWGFEIPAADYIDGDTLRNDVGFPSFMAATFYDNDPSIDQRKSTFCSQTRSSSDWLSNPNSTYNQEWFDQYYYGLQNYLYSTGYLDKAYYYMANEPQNQDDYDAVAWYSRYLKEAAPDMKLMVSEEPKPEIYNHSDYVSDAQIDIWTAHWGMFLNPDTSLNRLSYHNEETWMYFLKSTYLPRFNSITIDHPGIEGKFCGWFLWKYRLRGLAYYQFNNWGSNPWTSPNPYGQNGECFLMYPPSETNSNITYGSNNHRFVPSVRLEMIRDGLEDYEYFYLLNNSTNPAPYQQSISDLIVDKIIGGITAYNRDSEFMYNLRRLVGMKLGGEISDIPDIFPEITHSRSLGEPLNYYINFQDPAGDPTGTIIFNGHTYNYKIGNSLYDSTVGYGWHKAAEVPWSSFYNYWDQWSPNSVYGSSVINDWGRNDVFEFNLPNGYYWVNVIVGYRNSSIRHHKITIEGEKFIDNETTSGSWIERKKLVLVEDYKLTVEMGLFDYCSFLNALEIESADNTWTGAVSTNWHIPGNWSKGSVPDSTSIVIIPDVSNDPVLSSNAKCYDLMIDPNVTIELNSNADLIIGE